MMASSSTLLSMSMPPTPEPGLAEVQQGTCAACSLDVSEKVSQLFKRYEQLQDSINNFMLRQAEGKAARKPKHRQVRLVTPSADPSGSCRQLTSSRCS